MNKCVVMGLVFLVVPGVVFGVQDLLGVNHVFVQHVLTQAGDSRSVAQLLAIKSTEMSSISRVRDSDETYRALLSNGDELEASLSDDEKICSRIVCFGKGKAVRLWVDERYFLLLKQQFNQEN